ncbi:MAG: hypothetical protein AB7V62_13975 [Thermoleophilia bacterium]
MFFAMSSWLLAFLLVVVVFGATAVGLFAGRRMRASGASLKDPLSTLQAATLGIVGLLLAFGLSLAIGRYEDRRAAVVNEANAIGTTYLRAQTLEEPQRSESIALLREYVAAAIVVSNEVPESDAEERAIATQEALQRRLWALAGQALDRAPVATAPHLYVETLNEMIDAESVRVAALNNRVPDTVLVLEILASVVALALLAMHLAVLGRGTLPLLLAAGVVTVLLFVTFDLDRPTRGLVTVPDTAYTSLQRSMELPPAAE